MRYVKRLDKYAVSNVELSLNPLIAWSYNWWVFCFRYKGKVVFNDHPYSQTTRRHQRNVENLLADLGIKIDVKLHFTKISLEGGTHAFLDEIFQTKAEIERLEAEMKKPRILEKTKKKHQLKIDWLNEHIENIKGAQ